MSPPDPVVIDANPDVAPGADLAVAPVAALPPTPVHTALRALGSLITMTGGLAMLTTGGLLAVMLTFDDPGEMLWLSIALQAPSLAVLLSGIALRRLLPAAQVPAFVIVLASIPLLVVGAPLSIAGLVLLCSEPARAALAPGAPRPTEAALQRTVDVLCAVFGVFIAVSSALLIGLQFQ